MVDRYTGEMVNSVSTGAIFAALACVGYAGAIALHSLRRARIAHVLLLAAWLLQGAALALVVWGLQPGVAPRFGFALALSGAGWLVVAIHAAESRFLPLPSLQKGLAAMGALVSALQLFFPGEVELRAAGWWMPLHLSLGVGAYGLLGAAVVHALLLGEAESRLRKVGAASQPWLGMPVLRLERLTFRLVDACFAVLSVAIAVGVGASLAGHLPWRWDHKTVLSLMGWVLVAFLVVGRHWRGWRGPSARRWLYLSALLLVLAYVGSRFVANVLLGRGVGA